MPVTNDIELFNFDSDSLNPGDTVFVYNYLNNVWKSAIVQEIDVGEREILVNYEDDSQEWISVDTRKICFTIPEEHLTSPLSRQSVEPYPEISTPTSKRRKGSTNGEQNGESSTKKSKLSVEAEHSFVNQEKKDTSLKKESSRHTRSRQTKTSIEKKVPLTKPITSAFPRLKFKTSPNFEMGNRKRDKRESVRRARVVKTDNVVAERPVAEARSETSVETVTKRSKSTLPKLSKDAKEDVKVKTTETRIAISRRKGKQNIEQEVIPSERSINGSSESLKRKSTVSANRRDSLALSNEITPKPNEKSGNIAKTLPFAAVNKKIKTLLPKRTLSVSATEPVITSSAITSDLDTSLCFSAPLSSIYSAGPVLPLPVTPNSSGCACPVQDCKKPFRNEKLLMMHIRHYHQEYSNMLSSTPNVADLAYARTVGENIESPQAGFLEKIMKLEEDRQKEKTDPETSIIEDTNMSPEKPVEDITVPLTENAEKVNEQSPKLVKSKNKSSKRLSGSSPCSPSSKVPVLVAQLQEPPLVPPTISIQSENMDSEISVSQSTPCSPQHLTQLKPPIDKISPLSDLENKSSQKKKTLSPKKPEGSVKDRDVVNCTCGYGFDDGLMMMCELCCCWQHASCNAVENEDETPAHYICEPCQFPRRQHSSKKYCYAQSWLKDGKLPSFDFVPGNSEVMQKREEFLKLAHGFICKLAELKQAVRSLQVKIQILRQTPNHPKLYLWAKSWNDVKSEEKENKQITESGPVPEAAINTADCRKHLSEHIEEEMSKVEFMLKELEDKIEKITYDEDEQDKFGNEPEKDKNVAKQTLLMMIRDLSSVQNLKYC